MTDLSKLSDDDLQRMLDSAPESTPPKSLRDMSDEQLMKLASETDQPEDTKRAEYNRNLEPFMGDILPVSRQEYGGEVSFDSDAGIVGSLKRVVQLPKQVIDGEVDPMSQEGMSRTLEAAMVMSPMSPVSRLSGGTLAPKGAYNTATKKAPTRAALKEATDAGYAEARAMGAEYAPGAVAKWADNMARSLDKRGQIAANYPEVHNLLNQLKNPPDGAKSITLESVDAIYKELGRLAGSPDKAKASAAGIVQKGLDDFHSALDSSSIVAGTATPEKAATVLKNARGNAAAGFRSDRITGLEQTSARRTAAANSGRNADNNIRQRLTSLIESNKGSRGLSQAEKDAIDDIIFGKPTKNAARYISNVLGAGGGMGQTLAMALGAGGGAFAGGGPGAMLGALLPAAVGTASRGVANHMTKKELKMLDAMIRGRSPLANSTPTPAPGYRPGAAQSGVEGIARALMAPTPPPYGRDGWI